jgi:pyruvate dehydrogenase E2 component (dihydrolipoamide acetyltransferase)
MTLSVSVYGRSGPAAVLLHGFGTVGAGWDAIAALLAGRGRAVVPDLPGHGGSLAHEAAGRAAASAEAVLDDLAERGIEKAHLCGHSFGGAVAVCAALAAPGKIASLTLLAPGGFGAEINGRLLRRYAAAETADEVRGCLESMYGFANDVPEDAVMLDTGMRAAPGQSEKLADIAARLTRGEKQGVLALGDLSAAPFPVSVFWGMQDCMLPAHQARGLPERFSVRLLDRTGHMLPREAADMVSAHMLAAMGA